MDYARANSRHLFVTSVSRVFETMRLRIAADEPSLEAPETIAPIVDLLASMADALKWSLVHSEADCGAYIPLPWITGILQCYHAAQNPRLWEYRQPLANIPLTGDERARPIFLFILRLVGTCLDRGLITDQTAASDFEQLLMLLEDPELPPLPADLTLEALAVRRATEQIENPPSVSDIRLLSRTSLTLHHTQIVDVDDSSVGSEVCADLSMSPTDRAVEHPPAVQSGVDISTIEWDFDTDVCAGLNLRKVTSIQPPASIALPSRLAGLLAPE